MINASNKTEIDDESENFVLPKYQIVNTSEKNLRIALELHRHKMQYDDFKLQDPIFTWERNGKELLLRKQIHINDYDNSDEKPDNVVIEIPDGMVLQFKNNADELFGNITEEEKEIIVPGNYYKMQNNEIVLAD